VALVRDGETVRGYLNGNLELEGKARQVAIDQLFLGGRSDNSSNWEGRLDEIAIFRGVLSDSDIRKLALNAGP
jgi:hypothetical protein